MRIWDVGPGKVEGGPPNPSVWSPSCSLVQVAGLSAVRVSLGEEVFVIEGTGC